MHPLGYIFRLRSSFPSYVYRSLLTLSYLPQGDSEELIGKWFARTGNRSKIFLATKFGVGWGPGHTRSVKGNPKYVRETVSNSLKLLQTDYIDLLYQHRPDPDTPIEITVGAMKEFFEYVASSSFTFVELGGDSNVAIVKEKSSSLDFLRLRLTRCVAPPRFTLSRPFKSSKYNPNP